MSDPLCSTSRTFMELGASVVREVAKMTGGQVGWGWGREGGVEAGTLSLHP